MTESSLNRSSFGPVSGSTTPVLPSTLVETIRVRRAAGDVSSFVMSKKEGKIQQLIRTNKDLKLELKRTADARARLEMEREQSQSVIAEMRGIIGDFQYHLEGIRDGAAGGGDTGEFSRMNELERELVMSQSEAERFRKETGVLTRALAVHAVESGVDSGVMLTEGSRLWSMDQLKAEVERLLEVERELDAAKQTLAAASVRLGEEKEVRQALAKERVEKEGLRRDMRVIEVKLAGAEEEVKRVTENGRRVHAEIAEERLAHKREVGRMAEKVRQAELAARAAVDLEMSENRLRQRLSELEPMLASAEQRETAAVTELESLRRLVSGLDAEVRHLADSLSAESECNGNLAARLEKVETDLRNAQADVETGKRREKESLSVIKALEARLAEADKVKGEVQLMHSAVRERELRISHLENSREAMRGEINRLTHEVRCAQTSSNQLEAKCIAVSKEKEKIKSLLASDTMARLGPLLQRGALRRTLPEMAPPPPSVAVEKGRRTRDNDFSNFSANWASAGS